MAAQQGVASRFKKQITGDDSSNQTPRPQPQQSVVKNVAETAQRAMDSVAEQVGVGGGGAPNAEAGGGEQQFDEAAYREKIDRDEKKKLQELRARLAQITREMNQAGYDRQRSEQEWAQNQQQLMEQQDRGGLSEEEYVKKQQEEALPAAVKSRQGTGESGKRNRKG